jgi:hypothetical protein
MIKKTVLIFIFGAFAAQAALAQEVSGVAANIRPRVPEAPSNAIEFGLGGGYAQGVGDIGGSSPTLTELTHGGGEIQLNIGYRWNPNWLFGIYGTGGKYNTGNNTPDGSDAYSATAGVQANYHILPGQQWDPWVGLGVGWRGHWISKPNGTDSRHGMDIARLQVGVDYKVSPEFAISPFVGASATMFFTQSLAGQAGGFSNINDPNVNFFFTGGVMGRFDVMGIAG